MQSWRDDGLQCLGIGQFPFSGRVYASYRPTPKHREYDIPRWQARRMQSMMILYCNLALCLLLSIM